MAQVESNEANELCYIYLVLVKLNYHDNDLNKYKSLFPRKFLLKLLNDRLAKLDKFGEILVTSLYTRLLSISKETNEQIAVKNKRYSSKFTTKCFELDEYFHYCLYYLHDFIIDFGWYEPDMGDESGEHLLDKNFPFINDFFAFKKIFTEFSSATIKTTKSPKKKVTYSPDTPVVSNENKSSVKNKSIKSSLSYSASFSRTESPSRKRRVQFKDSPGPDVDRKRQRDFLATQSILALDLLIYGLNLFVKHLSNQLVESTRTISMQIDEFLEKLRESKRRIKSSELENICKEIKISIDIHLTILEHLNDIKKIYLSNFLLGILCSRDSEKLLRIHKRPRIQVFIERVIMELERGIVARLAEESLQLFNDLLICELNITPIDMNSGTKSKSREEMARSRENYFNFITNWLNLDDIVFGYLSPAKRTKLPEVPVQAQSNTKMSTLATGNSQFKSSSRILSQMDNLTELMRCLLADMNARIRSEQELKFLLDCYSSSLEQTFDILSGKLLSHLRVMNPAGSINDAHRDLDELAKNLDSMSAKIRCLKLSHIYSSMDRIIKEIAARNKIDLSADGQLSSKLNSFTDNCTNKKQETGNRAK